MVTLRAAVLLLQHQRIQQSSGAIEAEVLSHAAALRQAPLAAVHAVVSPHLSHVWRMGRNAQLGKASADVLGAVVPYGH